MAEPIRSARRRRRSSSASPPPAPRRRRGLFDLSDAPPFQPPVRARRGPARVPTGPSMPSVILDFSAAPPAASVPSGDASMEPPPTVAASVPSATASLDVPMGLVSPRQEGHAFSASASPALLLRRRRGLEKVSSLPISTGAGSAVPSPGLRHALPSPGRQRAGRPSGQARDSSRGSGRGCSPRGSGSSGRARGRGRCALDRRAVVVCSSPLPSPAAHVPSDRPAPVPISLEEDARRREIRLGKPPVDDTPAPVHIVLNRTVLLCLFLHSLCGFL